MALRRVAAGVFAALVISSAVDATVTAQDGQKHLGHSQNDGSDSPFTDSFADFVGAIMDEWKVPGLSIAVIDGHDIYTEVQTPHQSYEHSG